MAIGSSIWPKYKVSIAVTDYYAHTGIVHHSSSCYTVTISYHSLNMIQVPGDFYA